MSTLNENTAQIAAQRGHLATLQHAHENGCPWTEYTCSGAALNGHLDCLQYAHKNGCPWNIIVLQSNHSCIQTYAVEYNCPMSFQDDVKTKTIQPVSYTHLTLPTIYSV